MRLDQLELQGFRNYQAQSASFDPVCNVIVGENAQGKTNLLEGILYLSRGRSPRARTDRELIGFQAEEAVLRGRAVIRDREFLLEAELFRDRKRRLLVNRVPAKSSAAFAQTLYTVFFCPEDLELIRQGAAARRKFLDSALCQLRPRYAAALTAYHRAYDHKTRILRDAEQRPDLVDLLPEFNQRLIQTGAVIVRTRAQFVEKLAERAAVHHLECSGGKETLTVTYRTVSSVENPLAEEAEIAARLREHMASHAAAERASRLCLSGPHKDDLLVEIDGREARTYSSQGQTRTAALALKLAERDIYQNATGEPPLLLLDDVLSELDPRRQEFVLNRISGGQVFITCCEDDRLPKLLGGRVLRVCGGALLQRLIQTEPGMPLKRIAAPL